MVLTKTDGDARGGAALSVRHDHRQADQVSSVRVRSSDALQRRFIRTGLASRILGMGDVLTLIEEVEQKVDKRQGGEVRQEAQPRVRASTSRTSAEQLRQMRNMGGISSLLDKLPGTDQLPEHARKRINDSEFVKFEAMINSMTVQERRFPALIRGSRKRRIAAGSGTRIQDVNRLLKQFAQMQKMMKRVRRKGGLGRMMQGLPGNVLPGLPGRS